jgi:hypothetical protein|tara:strand:+ start:494 stop:1330 length:837 start_codon:yes stop_codon:yes gene_type:complete
MQLLSIGSDAKTPKGEALGIKTAVQYLAPSKASVVINVCKWASDACIEACLYFAGRASFDANIPKARINRTRFFVDDRKGYSLQLIKETNSHIKSSTTKNFIPMVRLNGTSDLPWEKIKVKGTDSEYDGKTLMEIFPSVQFYDYTKAPINERFLLPSNYHLTYSRSEKSTQEDISNNLKNNRNVAIVFNACIRNNKGKCHNKCKCPLPKISQLSNDILNKELRDSLARKFNDIMIDGDEHDIRPLDEQGNIVGLRAKGKARWETKGFTVHVYNQIQTT